MNLVQIHVVGFQPLQAVVDRVHDVLARQAALIGVVSHRAEDFGGNHELVARRPEVLERAAQNLFTGSQGVDVSRVEEVDAEFQSAPDERAAFLLVEDPGPPSL